MNFDLRALAGFLAALVLAAAADAAPAETAAVPEIRVEGQEQLPSAHPPSTKVARPKAAHAKAIELSAPTSEELEQLRGVRRPAVPLQVGFGRDVPGFADDRALSRLLELNQAADGTYVAAVSITSPGAAALRVGLRVVHMQPEAIVRFYGPGAEVAEVTGRQILDTLARNLEAGESGPDAHTYWSPAVEAETIVFEVELPAGARPSELRIAVPQVSHLVTSARTGFVMPKSADACENDATCQAATWGSQNNAVARMFFQVGASGFLCTGTLLNDQDPSPPPPPYSTSIPYFLSANHCISSQSAASTLITYWFFRSSSCNGSAGTYVTKAGGAILFYSSAATDTSFMRLNDDPPAGAFYAGWFVGGVPAIGSAITGIHHPAGDLLKISFGNIDSYWICSASSGGSFSCTGSNAASSTFYMTTWTSGVTEPGSSGSGIFLNSGHYLVGQLFGGSSSCADPTAGDFYGRFDVAYLTLNGLSTWLGPQLLVTRSGNGSGTVASTPAGINCGATCSAIFQQGALASLTATPAVGSIFGGWSGACTGTGACSVAMSASTSVNASFTSMIPLTVSRAGSGTGTVTSTPAGINCGATCSTTFPAGTVVTLNATPGSGSVFTGWSGACTSASPCLLTMNSAASTTATFTAVQTLTVSSAGSGTGTVTSVPAGINCGATCSADFDSGTVVTLSAAPSAGSMFTGWSGACTGASPCLVTMSAAMSVTANFVAAHVLTVSRGGSGTGSVTSSPPGIDCGVTCATSFDASGQVTLSAVASPGSTFTGWGGPCKGTGPCTVAMGADALVFASFTANVPTLYSMSVTRSGTGTGSVVGAAAGIDCGAVCGASVAQGTQVTLVASPSIDSTFGGWSGACTGTGPCTVTMNAAVAVNASFDAASYPGLAVVKAGTGDGLVTSLPTAVICGTFCLVKAAPGTAVSLAATPAPGSTFAGWSGGGCAGTGSCDVTVNGPVVVTATFSGATPAPSTLTITRSGAGSGRVVSFPAGIDCGATCNQDFAWGTRVALSPEAALGSAFAGWSGACSGTGQCIVTLNAPATVDAAFAPSVR